MQADRDLTGLPFSFLIVHIAALIVDRVIGKRERLHDGVQTLVATAGDPDTDDAAIVILDRAEEKVAFPAEQGKVSAATGIPTARAGKAGGPGFHLKVGVAVKDRPQESVDLLVVDGMVTCINRVHEIFPPQKS
jgi:hypothetical protein